MLLAGLSTAAARMRSACTTPPRRTKRNRPSAKYHDAGFQQIKIYSLVTPPIVEAISAEAHRLGMTVTGHMPNGMTIEQAAAAGMDHIAHLAIRGEAGSDDVTRTIAFLREHKTVIDPTQSWNELLGHAAGTPIAAFQPGVAKIPAAAQPPVLECRRGRASTRRRPRTRLERGLRIVKALHDAGVPVVVGTDEGIPGHSVHREIELYVEAGLHADGGAAGGDDRPGAGDEAGRRARHDRARQARGPRRAEREPAGRDQQHPQRPLDDQRRPRLRRAALWTSVRFQP